ncbi:MAG: TerC family protein [Chloroflexi bacterium]|nr:TerC family protein [Chloroflexota bacterium]
MLSTSVLWIVFSAVIAGLLALDLFVIHRNPHEIKTKEAFWTSMFWIAISLTFNTFVFYERGLDKGLEFFTGYLIEKALSVDNIFVFVVIFAYFQVPPKYQHRVLFLGILGALVLRGSLIFLGAALIERFEWIIYVFGAFLVFTAYRLGTQSDEGVHPEKNPIVNLFRRIMPVTPFFHQEKFLARIDGVLMATPLLIVLIVVETTDVVFALDSIPAIFAITTDPFIVFTSNVFAILGLRALYFLLAGVMGSFRYLKTGLSFILGFIGVKMLIGIVNVHIPIQVSLGVIAFVLVVSVIASIIAQRREERQLAQLRETNES